MTGRRVARITSIKAWPCIAGRVDKNTWEAEQAAWASNRR
jgi:hypothetical protein